MNSQLALLDFFIIGGQLCGGLALFLLGMTRLSEALRIVAGNRLKNILSSWTTNRFAGMFTGAFITALIQSSTITTVLVVGFISAGLMSSVQSVGVIIGANIGSTVTAQLIAFKLTAIALPVFGIGYVVALMSKNEKVSYWAWVAAGLGLLFLGMEVMSDATRPLRDFEPFLSLMSSLRFPLWGILAGAVFTAIVQSSAATTGIVLALAQSGVLSLHGGIALILGANIGTCITAFLAAVGKGVEAKRAAVIHLLFNIAGVIAWMGFIGQLSSLVTFVSPEITSTTPANEAGAILARQIANAHTIFNVINALVCIGFVPQFVALSWRIVPDTQKKRPEKDLSSQLNEIIASQPAIALSVTVRTIGEMLGILHGMMRQASAIILAASPKQIEQLARSDKGLDRYEIELMRFFRFMASNPLLEGQQKKLTTAISITNSIENIGDILTAHLVRLCKKQNNMAESMSEQTQQRFLALQQRLLQIIADLQLACQNADRAPLESILHSHKSIKNQFTALKQHLVLRLGQTQQQHITLLRIESDVLDHFARMYYLLRKTAKRIDTLLG